jgi:hypothetical protein
MEAKEAWLPQKQSKFLTLTVAWMLSGSAEVCETLAFFGCRNEGNIPVDRFNDAWRKSNSIINAALFLNLSV